MIQYLKNILVGLFLVGIFGGVFAQDVTFYAVANKTLLQVGERFTLTFKLEGADAEIETPPLGEFRVIFGPSQSSNFSYVNGKSSRSTSISYVLIPEQPGNFKIPPAKAKINGKVYETNPVTLKVSGEPTAKTNTNSGNSNTSAAPKPKITTNQNVVLDVQANKKSAFLGEPVILTYTLYSRYSNLTLGQVDMPDLNGFWVEDYPAENINWEPTLTEINGYNYRKAILRKRVVYPQKTGTLETGKFELSCFVNRSFFNPGQEVKVESASTKINVKPFPVGSPANFSGYSGSFNVKSSVDLTEVKPDEAITYKVRISGLGNLKLVSKPDIVFPGDFEVYDPKTKEKVSLGGNGLKGYKEFEYLLIPRYPGQYEIPAFEFSFFNFGTKKYQTAKADAITVTVKGDEGTATTGGGVRNRPKKGVDLLNEDIRFISTDALTESTSNWSSPGRGTFWGISGGMFLAFLGAVAIRKSRTDLRADDKKFRYKKAGKTSVTHLKKAKQFLKQGNQSAFYEELHKSLTGYFADKYGMDNSQVNRPVIRTEIGKMENGVDVANTFIHVLDSCEMAKYSPQSSGDDEGLLTEAEALILKMEGKS